MKYCSFKQLANHTPIGCPIASGQNTSGNPGHRRIAELILILFILATTLPVAAEEDMLKSLIERREAAKKLAAERLNPNNAHLHPNPVGQSSAQSAIRAPISSLPVSVKMRIAILPIATSAGRCSFEGGPFDPGRAISDLLISRLSGSSRFTVYDRNNMQMIMQEQNFGQSGRITAETASRIGRLAGVQYLVTGSVTEFSQVATKGGGITLPTEWGKFHGEAHRNKIRTAVEIQVIDVETGLVAAAISDQDESSVGNAALAVTVKEIETGYDNAGFLNSALGKSMNRVAQKLATRLEAVELRQNETLQPLEGYVMGVESDRVFLNIGSKDGVMNGMTFEIGRQKEFSDPATGVIKKTFMPLGELKVLSVEEDSCVGSMTGCPASNIAVKDFARRR
ncbi:MAG: hypothetical protein HQM09_03620 [Candidatus Riflebacteria bacterium]|nr:hypothetical protein [Candidatus Riflebacteria bacterium]